jgi:putative resolvase
MKLADWARKYGLKYKTAFRLFQQQKLPVKAVQLETGTILVEDTPLFAPTTLTNFVYCRVSSHAKKDDLERQAARCNEFCAANGWKVEQTVKEIASGLNDKRPKLTKLLDGSPKRIIVEHKDRLTRFGFNYFDTLLPLLGYELCVINRDAEDEHDLMKDFIAIITSFCCRLYGLRRGNNKSARVKKLLREDEGQKPQ